MNVNAMNVEITIPVLNEQKTIEEKIRHLHDFIQRNLRDLAAFKIVIADNGSSDETPAISRMLEKRLDDVEYIRIDQKGVGRALKASWARSDADIIGYMDLDLATDLKHIRPALESLIFHKAHIVTGSRLAKGATVIGRSPIRNLTSRCFNLMVRCTFSTAFTDGMCGFKFLRKDALDHLMRNGAQSDGWFFATELLVVAEFLDYKVVDLPVFWTDDRNSKVKIMKLSSEYIRHIYRLRAKLKKIKTVNANG